MVSPKRLVERAKKGIPLMRSASSSSSSSSSCDCNAAVADKGHFIVYTVDERRFMVPLAFLKSSVFQKLLRVSEEEFGLPGDGPITVACTAAFMEYVVSLLRRCISGDVERALLVSVDANRCSASVLSRPREKQHRLLVASM